MIPESTSIKRTWDQNILKLIRNFVCIALLLELNQFNPELISLSRFLL